MDGNIRVQGDRSRLKQVFTNLLTNALNYTEEGATTIGLEEHRNEVIVAVQDTSSGIAPELHSRFMHL